MEVRFACDVERAKKKCVCDVAGSMAGTGRRGEASGTHLILLCRGGSCGRGLGTCFFGPPSDKGGEANDCVSMSKTERGENTLDGGE